MDDLVQLHTSPLQPAENLVSVTSHLKPFSLLSPGHHPPRVGPGSSFNLFNPELSSVLDQISSSGVVALDWETNGLPLYHPDFRAVGLGLAWDTGSAYWDLPGWERWRQEIAAPILQAAAGRLVAHNVYYDDGVAWRVMRQHGDWLACTYGLYYQLANEGFLGQQWGLKPAQRDLLGWRETNEGELDSWLIDAGYIQNFKKEKKEDYYHRIIEGEDRWVKPDKSQMWRAPMEILGKYCILDAEACYLLFTRVLNPVLQQFPGLVDYHARDFLPLVNILVEQHQLGMQLDGDKLASHGQQLGVDIQAAVAEFRGRPEVEQLIHQWETGLYSDFMETEPQQFIKVKLGTEPAQFKKDGEISKNWEKWVARKNLPAQLSKNWISWNARREQVEAGLLPEYRFNLNSDKQLGWLLYDQLGYPVEPTLLTETGKPSLSEDALGLMGDLGKILVRRNLLQKEREYVESYLNLLTGASLLHPSFRVPGTLTGRLAGKDPNIQQVPKTRGTLSCFIPRPGTVWVDCDVNALEQVVLAELSNDPSLLQLYGPGAKPNDVYLFVGSQLPGGLGDRIRAAGYDPTRPSPEGIAAAKKSCKTERSIAKTVVLASSYGAGPAKIHKTLRLAGIDITEDQVRDIHRTYWDIFQGVKVYSRKLEREWTARGGWVMNGVGRPIGVDEMFKKDIVNRVVQSTGHDLLLKYIRHLRSNLSSIPWAPIIMDWHDQTIVEVPEAYAEEVKYLMETVSFSDLNQELGGTIPLKGTAAIVRNLAESKLEN